MRECGKCHLQGDDASFYPNFQDGSWCKRCINEKRTRYVKTALEKARELGRTQVAILGVVKQFQADGRPFVYLMQSLGRCKIGYSRDINKRIRSFNTANPKPCQLLAVAPGGRQLEKELHRSFAATRIAGEWFANTNRLVGAFSKLPGAMVFLKGYVTQSPLLDVPAA